MDKLKLEKRHAYNRRYQKSEKGRAAQARAMKKYMQTDKYKIKYEENKEKIKTAQSEKRSKHKEEYILQSSIRLQSLDKSEDSYNDRLGTLMKSLQLRYPQITIIDLCDLYLSDSGKVDHKHNYLDLSTNKLYLSKLRDATEKVKLGEDEEILAILTSFLNNHPYLQDLNLEELKRDNKLSKTLLLVDYKGGYLDLVEKRKIMNHYYRLNK